jgi:PadR family transcriptional regulator, regulatory protein PadR
MSRSRAPSPQTRAVLDALMAEPQAWRYGYDLSKETGLKSGTLYPLLMRLSDQGLLEAEWRAPLQPGRPARHAYRLTGKGLSVASALPRSSPSGPRAQLA